MPMVSRMPPATARHTKPVFDWAKLIANKDRDIARLELAYTTALERSDVSIVKARAVLEDAHNARLSTGETIHAEHVLVATGGAPWNGPDIPGIEHAISSNEAFHLERLPKRILIQGGGYIAVEFAGIFHGLGSEVTLVYRGENILRGFDDDLRAHLRAEMENRGIKIVCGEVVKSIQRAQEAFSARLSDGSAIEVDKVMFAIGRWPGAYWDGPRNRRGGFSLRNRGVAASDPFSRSSVPHIYAVGDVMQSGQSDTGRDPRKVTHSPTPFFGNKPTRRSRRRADHRILRAGGGLTRRTTEAEACERLARVDIYKTSFRPMKMSLAGRDTRRIFKLVVDGTTDRVVGCHIVGPDAGEMIQVVGTRREEWRATKADFDATMAVHPTAAEELVTMREGGHTALRQAAGK